MKRSRGPPKHEFGVVSTLGIGCTIGRLELGNLTQFEFEPGAILVSATHILGVSNIDYDTDYRQDETRARRNQLIELKQVNTLPHFIQKWAIFFSRLRKCENSLFSVIWEFHKMHDMDQCGDITRPSINHLIFYFSLFFN